MLDTHTHRDHRREAAMATNQSNGRGYFFPAVPAEAGVPGFVWKFIAWTCGLTGLFVCMPAIVRALMAA
jgi:hypothetical protein